MLSDIMPIIIVNTVFYSGSSTEQKLYGNDK